jgi:GT2 family glycosyltransferase/glycosyltransferase involved in cell wall biosynthesis
VTFLYEQLGVFDNPKKYLSLLDELGVEHAQDPLGVLSEPSAFRGYNICVIGWYSLAAAILPAVREALPGVRIAVDSVDIHWAREELSEQAGVSDLTQELRRAQKRREMRVYSEADEVWVVSEDEAAIVAAELPAVKLRVVGVPCAQHPQYVAEPSGDRALFVGGFAHPPNETAALWAAEVVTEYNKRYPMPRTLEIVGPQPPASVQALAGDERIRVLGFVPSLDEPHSRAKVFLCPMKFGGGVKGKISDAICRGIPVITNSIGNEGLGLRHGKEILLGETTEDFIALLDDVYSGRVDCEALRRNALQVLLDRYGEAAIRKQLLASFVAPPVVIGIVTYNQRELLRACLTSILGQTNYLNFKVAVISNGCSDGTVEMLKEFAEWYPRTVDVHLSESNDFFVRPCNQIISWYSDSDIVLMNNDVEVTHPGWLTNLVDAAYFSSHVCGSGGLIFDPLGIVSEAGAEVYATGLGRNLYRGAQEVSGAANAIRPVGFVSGCLMYMRRDAISRIGALDDDYHPMYFEDVAWHYTAHRAGLKTIYTPWARAIHKEGSTAGQDLNAGMKRFQEINREKFLRKFAGIDLEGLNPTW